VPEFPDVQTNALAILESQLLNYRSRSSAILDSAQGLSRVYATGGAAKNGTIVSLMADVLGAEVCKNVEFDPETGKWDDANWNACSVGMAYKARWGWERHTTGRKWALFDEVVQECRQRRARARGSASGEDEGIRVVATPGPGAAAYDKSVEWWQALEQRALRE
jgi:xylulokinase